MSNFLTKYVKWYSNNQEWIKNEYQKFLGELNHFLDLYGVKEKLERMTIDDYTFRTKGNRNTLCYLIDFGTEKCGINRGPYQSGYQRYGIQFKENGIDCYPFCNGKESKYGKTKEKVFEHFQNEIIKLLEYVISNNLDAIGTIEMPAQFTNKLHFIFSKNHSIPIYTNEHCKKILKDIFGLANIKDDSTFNYRRQIYDILSSLNRSDITPWHFMTFVYSDEGYKSLLKPKEYKNSSLVNTIGSIKNKDININKPVVENDSNPQLVEAGKKGEQIAYEYLINHQIGLDIKEGSIVKVCELKNSTDHCDFKYETNDGKTIYIEVKATSMNRPKEYHFKMSAYEYEFMLKHYDNYRLWYINDVYNNKQIQNIGLEEIRDKLKVYTYYMNGKIM